MYQNYIALFLGLVALKETTSTVLEPRIVGGRYIDITSVPYQIQLYRYRIFQCGGVIISPHYVLTASHCMGNKIIRSKDFHVFSGSSWQGKLRTLHEVRMISCHPYSNENDPIPIYDIALLTVDPPFQFNKYCRPINISTTHVQLGDIVTMTGWGNIKLDVSYYGKLRVVKVPVATCYIDPGTDAAFCAGGYNLGGCFGDSGGPIVKDGELVGLTTFGYRCNEYRDRPGVHTYVVNAEIASWIHQTMHIK